MFWHPLVRAAYCMFMLYCKYKDAAGDVGFLRLITIIVKYFYSILYFMKQFVLTEFLKVEQQMLRQHLRLTQNQPVPLLCASLHPLTRMSFLCWKRVMGNRILLHRIVSGYLKWGSTTKEGDWERESKIARECIPASTFSPASGASLAARCCHSNSGPLYLCPCVCVLVWECETRDVIPLVTSVARSWLPSCWLPWDQTDTSSASVINLFLPILESLNRLVAFLFSEKCHGECSLWGFKQTVSHFKCNVIQVKGGKHQPKEE